MLGIRRKREGEVKIRYDWNIRKKMIASVFVHYLRGVLRPTLRAYDKIADTLFRNYKAEGYEDLMLGEWLRIRWCEIHKRHVGVRVSHASRGYGPSMRYCGFCQCDWRKFEHVRRYDKHGKRKIHRSK